MSQSDRGLPTYQSVLLFPRSRREVDVQEDVTFKVLKQRSSDGDIKLDLSNVRIMDIGSENDIDFANLERYG